MIAIMGRETAAAAFTGNGPSRSQRTRAGGGAPPNQQPGIQPAFKTSQVWCIFHQFPGDCPITKSSNFETARFVGSHLRFALLGDGLCTRSHAHRDHWLRREVGEAPVVVGHSRSQRPAARCFLDLLDWKSTVSGAVPGFVSGTSMSRPRPREQYCQQLIREQSNQPSLSPMAPRTIPKSGIPNEIQPGRAVNQ